jgi:hypothetical protein
MTTQQQITAEESEFLSNFFLPFELAATKGFVTPCGSANYRRMLGIYNRLSGKESANLCKQCNANYKEVYIFFWNYLNNNGNTQRD